LFIDREEKVMEITKNIYRETAWIFDIEHSRMDHGVTASDIPFYLEYANLQQGEILELGCGTGRVSLALASEGFSVTGLDLSKQMLDIFQAKLESKPELTEKITLIHGNMADFSISKKFALIIAPFRAFQAVTAQEDIENTLSCVREHLSDNGVFILNVFNPNKDPLDESWCRPETFIDEITDDQTGIRIARYECRERIDPENQIIYPYLAYDVTHPDGHTERLVEPLQMKYYYSRQLRAEVEKAGFEIIDEYSGYDKSPPGDGEIILICRRKE
jgi:SAM-dependent methyltransferase